MAAALGCLPTSVHEGSDFSTPLSTLGVFCSHHNGNEVCNDSYIETTLSLELCKMIIKLELKILNNLVGEYRMISKLTKF